MKWYKIDIETQREKSEEVSDFLLDSGCNGLQIYDPEEIERFIKELDTLEYADGSLLDPYKDSITITGYLPCDDAGKEKIDALNRKYEKVGISVTGDEGWEDNWKKYYKEFPVGRRVLICPGWKEPEKKTDRKVIYLDPGMAFGSGEHETTYMCIEALDDISLENKTVLDVGTGSGILSIIAAKLGAARVVSIDTDQTAVSTAGENISRNGASDRVRVMRCEISGTGDDRFDVIVANIVSKVLLEIKEDIRDRIKPGGRVILSGMIRDRCEEVLKDYIDAGFVLEKQKIKKEWVTLILNAQI